VKIGANMATENTRIVDFHLTHKTFALYLQFCASLSIVLKLVLHKSDI